MPPTQSITPHLFHDLARDRFALRLLVRRPRHPHHGRHLRRRFALLGHLDGLVQELTTEDVR